MESILDRAARVLAGHPAPALHLDELRRLVGGSGVGVTEEVLLRALRRGSGRFRMVDPWVGPWRTLEPSHPTRGTAIAHTRARTARVAREGGAPPEGTPGRRGVGGLAGLGRPWVVARPSAQGRGGRDGLRCLRQSLAHLGWTVDDGSPSEMARWCGLLHEERRVRRSARFDADAERTGAGHGADRVTGGGRARSATPRPSPGRGAPRGGRGPAPEERTTRGRGPRSG